MECNNWSRTIIVNKKDKSLELKNKWIVKALPFKNEQDTCNDANEERIAKFQKIFDGWPDKKVVFDELVTSVKELIDERNNKIEVATKILISELNGVKKNLNDIQEENEEELLKLKHQWFDAIGTWKSDLQDISKENTNNLKMAVAELFQKLFNKRLYVDNLYDMMLGLVTIHNSIQLENKQTVIDTATHLDLLWENYERKYRTNVIFLELDNVKWEPKDEAEEEMMVEEEEEPEVLTETLQQAHVFIRRLSDREAPCHIEKVEEYEAYLDRMELCCLEMKNLKNKLADYYDLHAKSLSRKFFEQLKAPLETNEWGQEEEEENEDDHSHTSPLNEEDFFYLTMESNSYFDERFDVIAKTIATWNILCDRSDDIRMRMKDNISEIQEQTKQARKKLDYSLDKAEERVRNASTFDELDAVFKEAVTNDAKKLKELLKAIYNHQKQSLKKGREDILASYLHYLEEEPQESDAILENCREPHNYSVISFDKITSIFQDVEAYYCRFVEATSLLKDKIRSDLPNLEAEYIKEQLNKCYLKKTMRMQRLQEKLDQIRRYFKIRALQLMKHEVTIRNHLNRMEMEMGKIKDLVMKSEEEFRTAETEYHKLYEEIVQLKDPVDEKQSAAATRLICKAKNKFQSVLELRKTLKSKCEELIAEKADKMFAEAAQILQTIRTFYHGGDYSDKEAANMTSNVTKQQQDIKKYLKYLKAKIDKWNKSPLKEPTGKVAKLMKAIKQITKESELQTKQKYTIEKCWSDIKRGIDYTRKKVEKVERELNCRKDSEELLAWNELARELELLLSYFAIRRDSLTDVSDPKIGQLEKKGSLKSNTRSIRSRLGLKKKRRGRARSTSRSSRQAHSMTSIDISNFWEMATSFVGKASATLLRAASSFKPSQSKQRTSLKSQYPELYETLNNLKKRSKLAWFDLVVDVLRLAFIYKSSLRRLILQKCPNLKESYTEKLNKIKNEFWKEVHQLDEEVASKLTILDKSLKIPHGHSNNADKLAELEAEMKTITQEYIDKYISAFEDYKSKIKKFIEDFTTRAQDLKLELKYLIGAVYHDFAIENNLNIIRNDIFFKTTECFEIQDVESELAIIRAGADDSGNIEKLRSLGDLMNVTIFYYQRLDLAGPNQTTSMFTLQSVFKDSLYNDMKTVNQNEMFRNMLQIRTELVNQSRENVDEAFAYNDEKVKEIHEWTKKWNANVQEIRSLFRIDR